MAPLDSAPKLTLTAKPLNTRCHCRCHEVGRCRAPIRSIGHALSFTAPAASPETKVFGHFFFFLSWTTGTPLAPSSVTCDN
uniref:Uncharacterized protein n=1 Tax=Oryza punctata TaxID=4537 RepID=A0A0E0LAE8_ORYPU